MNIAAVFAALDLDGLDPTTKAAAVAMAARAHRDGTVKVGLQRLALDLGVTTSTAHRVRRKLVDAKIIKAQKTAPGHTTIWRLLLAPTLGDTPSTDARTTPSTGATDPSHSYGTHEDSKARERLETGATLTPNGVAPAETVKAARASARQSLNGNHERKP